MAFNGLAKQSYRAGEDIEEGGGKKGRRQKKKEKRETKKEKREKKGKLKEGIIGHVPRRDKSIT